MSYHARVTDRDHEEREEKGGEEKVIREVEMGVDLIKTLHACIKFLGKKIYWVFHTTTASHPIPMYFILKMQTRIKDSNFPKSTK